MTKYTTEQKADIIIAEIMGQQAFMAGKPAAPACDSEVCKLMKNYPTWSDSDSAIRKQIMKNWTKGWHIMNMAAEVA